MTVTPVLAEDVAGALADGGAVVALETTLVAHGFPGGQGLDVALAAEARVRAAGAVPATIGVVDGAVRAGLTEAELERFAAAGESARKVGARDLAACVVQGALGATTVGGTLAVCRAAGIRFMGTGGTGGVHRDFAHSLDISGDLPQLARTAAMVVSSGAKSILDVPATAELLETLGVPVLGWRTPTLPCSTARAAARRCPRSSPVRWKLPGSPPFIGCLTKRQGCSWPARRTRPWTWRRSSPRPSAGSASEA